MSDPFGLRPPAVPLGLPARRLRRKSTVHHRPPVSDRPRDGGPLGNLRKVWSPDAGRQEWTEFQGRETAWPAASGNAQNPHVSRYGMQATAKGLLPEMRSLQRCATALARRPDGSYAEGVQVWATTRPRRDGAPESVAFFRGLQHCGSPWSCPVCAARIAERRRQEVQRAIDAALARGNGVNLVTLTFPHRLPQRLTELLDAMSQATRRLRSGRRFTELKRRFGVFGEVRAKEVTWSGLNGWHPHQHVLVFTQHCLTKRELTQFRRRLYVLWAKACRKEGLDLPSYRRGVDVRGATNAAAYVAKWGFAAELSKAHWKCAAGEHYTPWQLLARATAGDRDAGERFREYARAFKGRCQLFWSKGLRDALGLSAEISDQACMDLVPAGAEQPQLLLVMDKCTWHVVCYHEKRDEVLAVARDGDVRELKLYLNRLRSTCLSAGGQRYGPREDWEL